MTERSYLFDFSRVDDFFENFNVAFFISEMWEVTGQNSETGAYEYDNGDGTNCYELVLISNGGDNISEYLDEYGCLDTSTVTVLDTQSCGLDWYNKGNGEATIELHGSVTFTIGTDISPLKAVLLRDSSTGYVMGYSINMQPFTVTNQVVFDDNIIFWDISRFKQ